ncbi:MAG TPA: hypothetical protein PKZ24_09455, partial [Nitrospirales bacterium]|nr:hypothetical protein [Nitrospirales bacterium]
GKVSQQAQSWKNFREPEEIYQTMKSFHSILPYSIKSSWVSEGIKPKRDDKGHCHSCNSPLSIPNDGVPVKNTYRTGAKSGVEIGCGMLFPSFSKDPI